MELIKHAAVKSEDGNIWIGKCHADCFQKAHYMKIKMQKGADAQGFMTSEGRFVNRVEGAKIALESGQVDATPHKVEVEEDPFDAGVSKVKILFSEDLWCPTYAGKHYYCELKGYLLKEVPSET